MAKSGFHPSSKGYRQVLNSDDAWHACDAPGGSICQTANMAGHGEYAYDTRRGSVRIHTRVKTTDMKSLMMERRTKVLRKIADHYR